MKVRLDRVLEGVLSAHAGRLAGQQQAAQEIERRDQEDFARALQMFGMMQGQEQAQRGQELDALNALGRMPNLTPDSQTGLAQRAAEIAGRPSQYNPASLMGMRGAPRGFGQMMPQQPASQVPGMPGVAQQPQAPPLTLRTNPDAPEMEWVQKQLRDARASGRLTPDQNAQVEQSLAAVDAMLKEGLTKAEGLKRFPFLGPTLTSALPSTAIDPKVYNSALTAMQKAETELTKALTTNPDIDPEERAVLSQLLATGVASGNPTEESHREIVQRTRQLLSATARLTSDRAQGRSIQRHQIAEKTFAEMLRAYGEGRIGYPDPEQARQALLQAEDDLNAERTKMGGLRSNVLGGLRGSYDNVPSREDLQADAARRIAKQFPEAQKERSARLARVMQAAKAVPVQDRAEWIRAQLSIEGIESGLEGDPYTRQQQLDRFQKMTEPKALQALSKLPPATQRMHLEEMADLADLLGLDVTIPTEIGIDPAVKVRLELEDRRVKAAEQTVKIAEKKQAQTREQQLWQRTQAAHQRTGDDRQLKVLKDQSARAWSEYSLFMKTNAAVLQGRAPGTPLRTDKLWKKLDVERAPIYAQQDDLFRKVRAATQRLEDAEKAVLGEAPAASSAPTQAAPAAALASQPGAAPVQPPPPKVSWKDQEIKGLGTWYQFEAKLRQQPKFSAAMLENGKRTWLAELRKSGYRGPF